MGMRQDRSAGVVFHQDAAVSGTGTGPSRTWLSLRPGREAARDGSLVVLALSGA
jgi:hypothetical protein